MLNWLYRFNRWTFQLCNYLKEKKRESVITRHRKEAGKQLAMAQFYYHYLGYHGYNMQYLHLLARLARNMARIHYAFRRLLYSRVLLLLDLAALYGIRFCTLKVALERLQKNRIIRQKLVRFKNGLQESPHIHKHLQSPTNTIPIKCLYCKYCHHRGGKRR